MRRLVLPLLLAALSTQASALPITAACQEIGDLGAAFDLGNGLVVQRWATDAFAPSGALGAHIAHCPTNEGIEVTAQVWNEHGRLPHDFIDPVAILDEAAQDAATIGFTEIVDRFRAQGLNAQRTFPADAACACAVFYPGTRGAGG